MAVTRRPRRHNDDGLSEVIGFVIIFGIIVILFSNYMLYGIPAQGRDSEIAHMNEVKDQFVDYKIGLDSLFNNNKISTTLSNSFTLGTGGSFSMGANSIIPIMSPVRSSGTIAINQRTTEPETLTITSQSLIESESGRSAIDFPPQRQINYTPSHIYVNIAGIQNSDIRHDGVFGTTINGTNWVATVNITPKNATYYTVSVDLLTGVSTGAQALAACPPPSQYFGATGSEYYCIRNQVRSGYSNISEFQLSVSKNNVFTMKNYPVYGNITPGTTYTIDLMDEAYGLNSFIQPPNTISLVIDKTLGSISATGNITYDLTEMSSPYYNFTTPLGALEYRAQNNYWLSQNYYYQLGGIFITQIDGNSTYKLPPEITFSNNTATNIVTVNINALVFDQTSRGLVGGNSPVQIKTTMMSNSALPYVAGTANTKWIQIGINTTDSQAREMWKNYFNYAAMVAGIPNYIVVRDDAHNQSYIKINGSDKTGDTYDINVIASNATFSTVVHGIGGTYT